MALAGGGLDGRAAAERLAHANAAAAEAAAESAAGTRSFFGWDVEAREPVEVLRVPTSQHRSAAGAEDDNDDGSGGDVWASVVELEAEKLRALRSAVEMACLLIGIDGVVVDRR